jgi:hypothetical protein
MFIRCCRCWFVDEKKTAEQNSACPRCGGMKFDSWPQKEIVDLFSLIEKYELNDFENKLVVCVFLCSALELLLEEQVSALAYEEALIPEYSMLVDILLDTFQGRSRLLQLYNRLGFRKFSDDLRELNYLHFENDWKNLAEFRNKIVHGNPHVVQNIDESLLKRLLFESLKVFQLLNNINSQNYSMNSDLLNDKKQKEKDRNRLDKWVNNIKSFSDLEDII